MVVTKYHHSMTKIGEIIPSMQFSTVIRSRTFWNQDQNSGIEVKKKTRQKLCLFYSEFFHFELFLVGLFPLDPAICLQQHSDVLALRCKKDVTCAKLLNIPNTNNRQEKTQSRLRCCMFTEFLSCVGIYPLHLTWLGFENFFPNKEPSMSIIFLIHTFKSGLFFAAFLLFSNF